RYRTMVEDSPALICIHSLSGEVLAVNPAATAALAQPAAQLVGRNLSELLARDVRDQLPEYLRAIAAERQAAGTMRIRTARGEERLWQYHNRVIEEPGEE